MADDAHADLRQTPLHAAHVALGGRLVPFAGYAMPVQYEGIKAEHAAVRERVGLFDVSHMGELFIEGPEAVAAVDRLVTNAVAALPVGKALYTVCTNAEGTILDDLIVYRRGEDRVMVVCNASNRAKIAGHFAKELEGADLRYADRSDEYALLALQGPDAEKALRAAGGEALAELGFFQLADGEVAGVPCIAARTGYTGEDGFELFCANADARTLWDALLAAGATPAGLGARDTLRLEAKLALYGNDIDETTNPYEAGLGWVVKLDHGDFIGRDALRAVKEAKPARKLVGFEMTGRGIARHGYPIHALGDDGTAGEALGVVTSGSPGPTVGKNIGLGYVPRGLAKIGTTFAIAIRGKHVPAVVVKTPFYKRAK
ncbi:MAG: glycine cleavage system aminomethyltransferase GcvT [Myxococcota bacterium]